MATAVKKASISDQPDTARGEEPQAWQLARQVSPLFESDTAGAAIEAFALQRLPALPVCRANSAIGYVNQQDLLAAVGGMQEWHANPSASTKTGWGVSIRPFPMPISAKAGLAEISRAFDLCRVPLLPVVDADGHILGYLLQADLLAPD